jgi:transposase
MRMRASSSCASGGDSRSGRKVLAKLGLTPQKPLERAYQRNPEAIEKWK